MRPAAVIYQLGILFTALLEVTQPQESRGWQEDDCRRALREALSVRVKAETPPKLSGHWTSYGCETRPGPEFVLRKYLFRRNSFNAQLYYYADEACTEVTHSYTAKGTYRPMRISWRTPGAHEAKYRLTQVVAIPYTKEKAKFFKKVVHRYCKPSKSVSLKPFRKFKIFQFTKYSKDNPQIDESDFDCLKVFNFTMNELQLMRIERRHLSKIDRTNDVIHSQAKDLTETELLLGDVSTNMKYRQQYRPTHYQIPLKKSKTAGCEVCATISSSNQWQPPLLQRGHVSSTEVVGEWVSRRCETRPNGQYLTRSLSFLPDGRSWAGVYDFYKDPLCQEPYFSLDLKGNHFQEQRSDIIPSAKEYIFRTTVLKVTARDFQMVQYLNSYDGTGCGKAKAWTIGVTQDVTASGGCVTLGINLPNIEYELMKAQNENGKTLLYVGQRPSDFATLSVRKNRPTSFQLPLIKCESNYNDDSLYSIATRRAIFKGVSQVAGKSTKIETFNPAPNGFISSPNLTMYLVARNTGIRVHSDIVSSLSLIIVLLVSRLR